MTLSSEQEYGGDDCGQDDERQGLLRRARALYAAARAEQDLILVKIWRRYRWAVLSDLYLARGDERGVERCWARANEGGSP